MGVSADIKKAFGDRVFVTSLDVSSARFPRIAKGKLKRLILQHTGGYHEGIRAEVEKRLRNLKTADENSLLVDERRVGAIENFSTRRKYDLIIDFAGGLTYSHHLYRILEVYQNNLQVNGRVLTLSDTAASFAKENMGENSVFATNNGYYFSVEKITKNVSYNNIFEIRKLPAPKPK